MSDEKGILIGGILFILVGLFSLLSAFFNWNWFFNNRKAVRFVNLFGRKGARIFYGILGALIIVFGIVFIVMA